MISHFFSSMTLDIIERSCCTIPSNPSTTTQTISALFIALSLLIIDQFSTFLVPTLLSLLIQAVSIRVKSSHLCLNFVSILSLVVPDWSLTIALSFPQRAFMRLDFPTFGLQSNANLIDHSNSASTL